MSLLPIDKGLVGGIWLGYTPNGSWRGCGGVRALGARGRGCSCPLCEILKIIVRWDNLRAYW